MKALVLEADGRKLEIEPNNGTDFTLAEMQHICGGTIDIQRLPKSNKIMVLNDNGKLDGLPKNEAATELWKMNYPIAEYPENNDELVVGNVIVCDREMVK